MGEPARKFREEDVLPEDAVLGPGTFQNVDNGRIIHKDHYGPLPPSGTSKRYIKLSDDPTFGMSPSDAREHRKDVERPATSYEEPTRARKAKTGEIVASGKYKCTNCGNEISFKDEGHLPPCSVCTNTEWERE